MKAKAKSGLKSMIKKGAKDQEVVIKVLKRMSVTVTPRECSKAEVGKTYYPVQEERALRKEKMKETTLLVRKTRTSTMTVITII